MDIFVKKLSDNKGYEFYFTFTKEEMDDCAFKQSIGKENAFDFINSLIEQAIIEPDKENELTYEYGYDAGNGWFLNEIICSDFQGEIKPYQEVFSVSINQEHPNNARSHAEELISTICYKLAEWNIFINKFMINAL